MVVVVAAAVTTMMMVLYMMPLFFKNIAVMVDRQDFYDILECISYNKAVDMLVIIIVASMLKQRRQQERSWAVGRRIEVKENWFLLIVVVFESNLWDSVDIDVWCNLIYDIYLSIWAVVDLPSTSDSRSVLIH